MFYGLFPPEVNSGMFDMGLGPAHFAAAGAQWEVLAATFATQTMAAQANLAAALAVWSGGAPVLVQMESSKLLAWLAQAQAVCQKNAAACFAVVQAWFAARATMVPLPVVIANRVAAASAEATTVAAAAAGPIGAPIAISSAATAAQLEAAYAAMWTMDATSMSVYHGLIVAATAPVTLPPPPMMESLGGVGALTAANSALRASGQLGQAGAERGGKTVAEQLGGQPAQQAMSQASSMPSQMMSPLSSSLSNGISDNQFNQMMRDRGLNPGDFATPDLGAMASMGGGVGGMGGVGGGGAGLDVMPASAALADMTGIAPAAAFAGVSPVMPTGGMPASPMMGGGGGMVPPMTGAGAGAPRSAAKKTSTEAILAAHPEFGELLSRRADGLLESVPAGAMVEEASEEVAEDLVAVPVLAAPDETPKP
ncbi:PPE family protein [Gordonia alkaliphila]|uniref:PPE domain-containing protein n=1 Tax=Gordonia alkaliphila TaxID=1053547 RepID=UPI001FF65C16|nr:PPE domain-containing protein [Gordonia alkaliphila]MCK0441190.1 PPE family protein [Gordonia alkaliphila]